MPAGMTLMSVRRSGKVWKIVSNGLRNILRYRIASTVLSLRLLSSCKPRNCLVP
jgi:hypothetical protein